MSKSTRSLLLALLSVTGGVMGKDNSGGRCPVIGIDLGTTYSCVGVMENGKVNVISNDQGNRITPSYVAFTETGERLIGDAAKNQLTSNPENTIFDAKRLIGREWSDKSIQGDAKYFPFKLSSKNNKPVISVMSGDSSKTLTPEEVSAMVLTKMKQTAESYLGCNVTKAVVTVPAYFNDAQRAATKDAGVIAGLDIIRIINEPTAAAIAYGLDKVSSDEKNVLVFDLGGGTFDVSLLSVTDGVFEVLSTNGDTHLGGEDFDQRVMEYFMKVIKKKTGKDIRQDTRVVQKLRREVEKAKRALSSSHQTRIEIESLIDGEDFSETLTRAKFEELNMDLFKDTLKPVKKVLDDAELSKGDVTDVILVGGSTRIPKVRQLVKEFFKGKEPRGGVNPDEAVAEGAAVQACILSGDESACGNADMVVIDTVPLSLGIETVGGVMSKVIPRNTAIPTKKSQVFSTAADNQEVVTIKVYEGERPMTKDNHLLGKFDLTGIPPAQRGVPQIEVTFSVNADGMLEVNARDKGSEREEKIVITNDNNRLTPEDIEKMLKEAEEWAEQDKLVKEKVDAKNDLEQYSYTLKRQLEDKDQLGGKLSEDDKSKISEIVNEKLDWLKENEDASVEEFKSAKKEIEEISQPIIAALYQNSSSQQDGSQNDEL